ncbi:MAG: glycoside hydrolase family 38 C-terminal domain-containing protein [Spirochaetales bacterium]
MLSEAILHQTLGKLGRLLTTLEPYGFETVGTAGARLYETRESLHAIPPDDGRYRPVAPGESWGGEGVTAWFRLPVTVPEAAAGRDLYLLPSVGGLEALLWVNGEPAGLFATKLSITGHGNHYAGLLARNARAGQNLDVVLEFYAGSYVLGVQPLDVKPKSDYRHRFDSLRLAVRNQPVFDFVFDLKTVLQLVEALGADSFRRADLVNALYAVHEVVAYDVDETPRADWEPRLARARELLGPVLAATNSASTPRIGLVGHSHIDTAWLWTLDETVRKLARTFSNQLSLLDRYPEYRFFQSSAYHLELMRRHYPSLFARIGKRIAEGRWEPGGAVWIESDANLVSGEALVRQFLWGQRYTREHFGVVSQVYWLPDTFGYSAALPQILKQSGVTTFVTTKLGWNDTNKFPYETFVWEGLDGTPVLAHFTRIHCWPDAKELVAQAAANPVKRASKDKLVAYGFGDGGGGPQFEMVEMARRVTDLEGVPPARHVRVGEFLSDLRDRASELPVHRGDLYLELHRGTLTSQHTIKRQNRQAETALHDLEVLLVANAVATGSIASGASAAPLWETLLVNQFHDILPGTSLAQVHDRSVRDVGAVIDEARAQQQRLQTRPSTSGGKPRLVAVNTLARERREPLVLSASLPGLAGAGPWQRVDTLQGERIVVEAALEPLSASELFLTAATPPAGAERPSPFAWTEGPAPILVTPWARVEFDAGGGLASLVDLGSGRELRSGLPLNTFLWCEDLPARWDNWDLDADHERLLTAGATLVERRLVGTGAFQCRVRSVYRFSPRLTLTQDAVFWAHTPRIDFETLIDWHEKHRFLKVAFDTPLRSPTVRCEVQFGHTFQPTTRNTTLEQARFEVAQHRFTDLSEPRFGVALLNDGKYGVSAEGGSLRLSLHKGGTRPDPRGDEGLHFCSYSLLPHAGPFSAEVVWAGYRLNTPALVFDGGSTWGPLAQVGADNVVLETLKPGEDADHSLVARLYEAEGSWTKTEVRWGFKPVRVAVTNLLEEVETELPLDQVTELEFRPFELKTLRVWYSSAPSRPSGSAPPVPPGRA